MRNTPSHLDNMEDYIITGIYNISENIVYTKRTLELETRFVCPEDFKNNGYINNLSKKAIFIDYYGRSKEEDTFFYDKQMGIISNITDKPLTSNNFLNCVGLVVIGKDKQTGKNIAFLTHNNPTHILLYDGNKEQYKNKLGEILDNFKKQCVQNTIDVVLLGGDRKYTFEEYKDFTALLDKIIEENLGFSLETAGGPSSIRGFTPRKSIIVNTEKRQIHFLKEYEGNNIDGKIKNIIENLQSTMETNIYYVIPNVINNIINNIEHNLNLKYTDRKGIFDKLEKFILNNFLKKKDKINSIYILKIKNKEFIISLIKNGNTLSYEIKN